MKLIYTDTGEPVNTGDIARTFRNEPVIVTGWAEPKHSGSTGRVYLREMGDQRFEGEYYPSVIGAQWVE